MFYCEDGLNTYDLGSIYGYIYKITLPDGRYYIGQKKGLPGKTQNYWGSGYHVNNWFKKYFNKPSNNCPKEIAEGIVEKEIIDLALDEFELDWEERIWITRAKNKQEYEGQCLNEHEGGHILLKRKGEPWNKGLTIATDKRLLKLSHKPPQLTEEQENQRKHKIKEAIKKRGGVWNKGLTAKDDPRLQGVKNRDTSYMKTKEWSENLKNLRWYTNGIINIHINKDLTPPEGFYKGMTKHGYKKK